MNLGWKYVYFLARVRNDRSTATLKSASTWLMNPAWRPSSRLMKPKSSRTSGFLTRFLTSAYRMHPENSAVTELTRKSTKARRTLGSMPAMSASSNSGLRRKCVRFGSRRNSATSSSHWSRSAETSSRSISAKLVV
jgi:hypothetical protein